MALTCVKAILKTGNKLEYNIVFETVINLSDELQILLRTREMNSYVKVSHFISKSTGFYVIYITYSVYYKH